MIKTVGLIRELICAAFSGARQTLFRHVQLLEIPTDSNEPHGVATITSDETPHAVITF